MLDIDALRSFITFADTGSFTETARLTFKTQSAISMQMKRLEAASGQTLFLKQGRKLLLTDQGRLLAGYARQILSIHDAALHKLANQTQYPPLVLGCPDDYAESLLPKLVEIIRARLPDLAINIHCTNSDALRYQLENNQIHLAILSDMGDREEGHILKRDVGCWVHGGYSNLLDEAELPLVLFQEGCKFRSNALDGLEKIHRQYRIVSTSSSATAIKGLIKSGVGVSAMAKCSLGRDLYPFEPGELPALPSVDILLKSSATPHPIMGDDVVAEICLEFMEQDYN